MSSEEKAAGVDVMGMLERVRQMSPAERERYFAEMESRHARAEERQRAERTSGRYWERLALPANVRGLGFSTFVPAESQRAAWQVLKDWALKPADNLAAGRGALFVAPPGRGKTAMLSAFFNELPSLFPGRAITAFYVNWAEYLAYSTGDKFDLDAWERAMVDPDFLFWDDIGVQRETLTSRKRAYNVLNRRVIYKKPTFFAMSRSPKQAEFVAEFGESSIQRMRQLAPKHYQCAWVGKAYFDGVEEADEFTAAADAAARGGR